MHMDCNAVLDQHQMIHIKIQNYCEHCLLDDLLGLEVKGTGELEQSLSQSELTVTDKSICLSDTL